MRIALIALAIAGALSGCNDASIDRYTDTPQEHQARLACEMFRMQGNDGYKAMSADDAEAYCEKEIEAQRTYKPRS